MVNAGSRMHVPSTVGTQTNVTTPAGGTTPTGTTATAATTTVVSGFSLVGEDGNLMPGLPKVQSDVFMAAGKTFDALINVTSTTQTTAFPIFDRELSLSGNGSERDAGMLAYIGVNGALEPAATSIIASDGRHGQQRQLPFAAALHGHAVPVLRGVRSGQGRDRQ